jgi:hypothetical protein
MLMEALLLTPYLVLASSVLLAGAVASICWAHAVPREPDYALPVLADWRHRFHSRRPAPARRAREVKRNPAQWRGPPPAALHSRHPG